MATIVLIVEIALVITFVILACKTPDHNEGRETTCPYCGELHVKPTKIMKDLDGRSVYHYEHCGHEWNTY